MSVEILDRPQKRYPHDFELDVYAVKESTGRKFLVGNEITHEPTFAHVATRRINRDHSIFGFAVSSSEATEVIGVIDGERVYHKIIDSKILLGLVAAPLYDKRADYHKQQAGGLITSNVGEYAQSYDELATSMEQ